MDYDLQPLFLTFKLAAVTTLILCLIGIPFAYWMAYTKVRIKPVLETLVSMPLVLPPRCWDSTCCWLSARRARLAISLRLISG